MMNRRKLTLAILLVVFAGAVVYAVLRQPPARTVAKLKYTSGMKADAARPTLKVLDERKVHLELLDRDMQHFSGFRRNIFRPIFSTEINAPLSSRKGGKIALPVPPPAAAVAPPPPPPPPTPAQIAQEEVGQFTFLGFLQKEGRKVMFLSRGNEILLMRKGDKVAGKYVVANITDEAMTIKLMSGDEEITVPLMQNRPLRGR